MYEVKYRRKGLSKIDYSITKLLGHSSNDVVCSYNLLSNITDQIFYDEIYENQRRDHFFGRLSFSKSHRLGDRHPFSTADGLPMSAPEDFQLSNPLWEWYGDWKIDEVSAGVGEDGWMYAVNWKGKWSSNSNFNSQVRRRRWVRFKRLGKSRECSTSSFHENKKRIDLELEVCNLATN